MARTKTRDASPVLQRYVFLGLRIAEVDLIDAEDNETKTARFHGHERLRPIKAHDIIETGQRHPGCRCESLGLHEGMTLDALIHMGSGCTPHWVCPRLDSLRRRYGH